MNRNHEENMDEKTIAQLNYQKRKSNYKLISIFTENEGEVHESMRKTKNADKKIRDPGFIEAFIHRKKRKNRPNCRIWSPWGGEIRNAIKYLGKSDNSHSIKHNFPRVFKHFKQIPLKDVNKFLVNENSLVGKARFFYRYN